MEITVTQEQGRVPIAVLHISGDITGHNYQQFEDRAKEQIEAGVQYLLLDLADVRYISSAGIRVLHYLLSLLPEYRTRPGAPSQEGSGPQKTPNLKLYKPSKRTLQALQLVGFDDFFEIYDDYDEAIASF